MWDPELNLWDHTNIINVQTAAFLPASNVWKSDSQNRQPASTLPRCWKHRLPSELPAVFPLQPWTLSLAGIAAVPSEISPGCGRHRFRRVNFPRAVEKCCCLHSEHGNCISFRAFCGSQSPDLGAGRLEIPSSGTDTDAVATLQKYSRHTVTGKLQ